MLRRYLVVAPAVLAVVATTFSACGDTGTPATQPAYLSSSLPPVVNSSTPPQSTPTALEETFTVEELRPKVPPIRLTEALGEEVSINPGEGLSFALRQPNEDSTTTTDEFCIDTTYGNTSGAVCANPENVGGILTFGYIGDSVNPPMALLLMASDVAITPQGSCIDPVAARSSAVQLVSCVPSAGSSIVEYKITTADGEVFNLTTPFVVPPTG